MSHLYYPCLLLQSYKNCSNQLKNEQNIPFASEAVNVQSRHIRANLVLDLKILGHCFIIIALQRGVFFCKT